MLSTGPKKKSAAKRLFSLGRKKPTSAAAPDGCDPKVFADEIAHYLTRSLEGRAPSANATAVKAATSQTGSLAQPADEWGGSEVLVEEFRTPAVEEVHAPVVVDTRVHIEDRHMPGSILDLRLPIAHAPVAHHVIEPELSFDATSNRPVDVVEDVPAFNEPEPQPPVMHAVAESEPTFDFAPGSLFDPAPSEAFELAPGELVDLEPERTEPVAAAPSTFIKPESTVMADPHVSTLIKPVEISQPNHANAAEPPATTSGTLPSATTSGTSPSFEAALAAIRAAWVKPEPKTSTAAEPTKTSNVARPLAGSGEVDLTNDIEALEVVTGPEPAADDADSLDQSRTSNTQRKAEKPRKRPEKLGGRRMRGPDGRDDWSVLDPNQCKFSALVNKLDEVTDSEETTTRATDGR
jgi:hypothetical protein